ncbi:uncharacterized protein LOC111529699 isoform X4 [Piliocolobus tephrosceles]|uniref:uncharacterized protein LOC111529699 isoform X4 n=1 Tax=Piliocolobus tephrosceles TaxID=591936 RepID=UPI000C2AC2FD|nr:uncharacterized protein LOC111529699 isoform X4 [Piliocolobus tephrosceles]
MSWDSAGPKAETCHSSSAGLHPETRQQLESSWRGNVSQTQLEAEDAQLERVVIDNSRKQPLRAPGQGSMLGCQLGCWLPVRLRYQRLQTLPCLVGGREARPTYPRLCAAFDPPTQSPPSKWSGLACLEQERHQRQGSQGQAEWRRPDQDIEDKILLLQTEVEKAQRCLDQMTQQPLGPEPSPGIPQPQLVDPELGTEPYWTSGPSPGIAGLGAEETLQD